MPPSGNPDSNPLPPDDDNKRKPEDEDSRAPEDSETSEPESGEPAAEPEAAESVAAEPDLAATPGASAEEKADEVEDEEEEAEAGDSTGWWDDKRPVIIVIIFIVLFLIAYIWDRTVITIYPGERGVLFQRIGGTKMDYVYKEGLNIIWPIDKMYIYETRVQKVDTEFKVLSENGLTIFVDMTIRFQPQISELPRLHREVGPDYVERVVIPEVKAVIRRIFGNYTPEQIYASQAGILQNVQLTSIGALRERFVLLDGIMIREIRLPESVAAAIQSKLRQEQLFLEYAFRLQREEEEAKRKAIEARGIANFQREIAEGLTPEYLRFRGIEATLRLAESSNAKVVVVGGGEDGLPLILNLDSMNAGPAGPARADSPAEGYANPNAFREEIPAENRPDSGEANPAAAAAVGAGAESAGSPPPSESLPPVSLPKEPPPR